MSRALRLVLIGASQQENLALEYLAAAADEAGHTTSLVGFNSRSDLSRAVEQTLRARPDVVGLGIAYQCSVDAYLELAAALRAAGYAGHLTCGGHVPTFCYAEILRDAPAMDTVVRHEGEQTLVELLSALARGESVCGMPGVVSRAADGIDVGPTRPPVARLDDLPRPRRRSAPFLVSGVPIGFVVAARGCIGECSYCCIRALTCDAGGSAYRMRAPEAVADEIADLYQRRGVRVVFFEDDLFVLPNERRTSARMTGFADALRDRGATDLAFWIKGRPETVTPLVLEAARRLGVIHIFLGIENAAPARLSYLGRTHRPEHARRALGLCREHGIGVSFNFMLFDPDCTLEDVGANLDFAEAHLELPWNICRTEIYSGTRLLSRLQQEGRLLGGYRNFGYLMRDPRAEIMFRVLRVSFRDHAFAPGSLLNQLISLSYAGQVHQRFFPGTGAEQLVGEIECLAIDAHRDSVQQLRRVMDFSAAADPGDHESARRFSVALALEVNERALPWRAQADRLWQRLHARGTAMGAAASR